MNTPLICLARIKAPHLNPQQYDHLKYMLEKINHVEIEVYSMVHPIQWFKERIGTKIKRGNIEIEVTQENYQELHRIQGENYNFTAPPVVHKSDNTCTSCEG
jgi:hypothetical protein